MENRKTEPCKDCELSKSEDPTRLPYDFCSKCKDNPLNDMETDEIENMCQLISADSDPENCIKCKSRTCYKKKGIVQ